VWWAIEVEGDIHTKKRFVQNWVAHAHRNYTKIYTKRGGVKDYEDPY